MKTTQTAQAENDIKWEVYPSRRYIIIGFEKGRPRFLAYEPVGHGRNRRVWHEAMDEAILYRSESEAIKALYKMESCVNRGVYGAGNKPHLWRRTNYYPALLPIMEVREIGFTMGRCCQHVTTTTVGDNPV